MRLWETVADGSRPISWPWEAEADSAFLTFSNRLTGTVVSTNVMRAAGTLRGSSPHAGAFSADETLVVATLVQKANGVEIARAASELAYVPGVAGRTMTVRTKECRDWWRVRNPRLAAYDAQWWYVTGSSGYEVLWAVPPGWHAVVREFEGAGVVDETVLKFGLLGFMMWIR